jgi:Spy/CpxP family protein refolding chaperone
VSDPTVPAPVSEKRKPSILLIVSLCLNLVFIGLAATMLLRGPPPRDAKVGLSPQALTHMVPAEKDKIEAVIDAHRPKLHELRQEATLARAELFNALSAKTFDKAAFAKAADAVQTADAALEAENLRTTADAVAVLTPEERDRVASAMPKPSHSWLRRMFRKR